MMWVPGEFALYEFTVERTIHHKWVVKKREEG